jgi:hypothetical protein
MNKYVIISLICVVAAFVGILSQGGHANTITYASVVPGVVWVAFLLLKAGIGWLADRRAKKAKTLSCFGPLLFFINFHLSGWWLLVLALVGVWVWALTRKSSGDYDFGPGMALCAAILVTLACLVGVCFGWVMA